MAHEKSITVERSGRHYLLDNSGKGKGNVIGPKQGFASIKAADTYAQSRSKTTVNVRP